MNRTLSACRAAAPVRLRSTRATSVDYAMIASGIRIAIFGTVIALGSNVQTTFYKKLASMF